MRFGFGLALVCALGSESNPRSSVFIGGQILHAVLNQYLAELLLAADQR